jgi:NAD(P)H-hydrate repair Nnr-like enzyme with NAD(P)H-hydrate dehydratase domain
MDDPLTAGACAAWTHGHAGEIAGGGRVRGVVLADVERALGQLWSEPLTALEPPVLAELPAVGDR